MKKYKKGFTITELVIVIAVIAILAAVLIPTFVTVFKRANESVALQETDAVMKEYIAEKDGKIEEGTIFVHTKGDDIFTFIYDAGILNGIDNQNITNNTFIYNEKSYKISNYTATNSKVTVYEIVSGNESE